MSHLIQKKPIPDTVPTYKEMLKTNDSLFQQNEIELTRGVLLETLDKFPKVKPLFIAEVVKVVAKILEGSGYGNLTIDFMEGQAKIIKGTEYTKIG